MPRQATKPLLAGVSLRMFWYAGAGVEGLVSVLVELPSFLSPEEPVV